MKIYRYLLLGIIFLVYSCGGENTPYDMLSRASTPEPGQLTLTADKPYVVAWAFPDTSTTDDITLTVTGGTGPYSLTALPSGMADAFTPAPPWVPAPSITLDPIAFLEVTRVNFAVTDAVGAVAYAEVIILPADSITGPLMIVLMSSATGDCDDATGVDVLVLGGVLDYNITSSDDTVAAVAPATVTTNPGTFTITPGACADVLVDTTVDITITDSDSPASSIVLPFTVYGP